MPGALVSLILLMSRGAHVAIGMMLLEDRHQHKVRDTRSAGLKIFEDVRAAFDELRPFLPPSEQQAQTIFWWHPCKTGSSFFTTLFHYACPRLPADVRARPCSSRMPPTHDIEYINPTNCDTNFSNPFFFHEGYVPSEWGGQAMGLIREPMRRVVSAYLFGQHGAGDELKEAMNTSNDSFLVFASSTQIKGYLVKMLSGKILSGNPPYPAYTPTEEDVTTARQTIVRDFRFIGNTDDFVSTVALFHGMFGGSPEEAEFVNVRKTPYQDADRQTMEDTLQAHGWVDEWDEPVFREGLEKFGQRVKHTFDSACHQVPSNMLCLYLTGKRLLPMVDDTNSRIMESQYDQITSRWSFTFEADS